MPSGTILRQSVAVVVNDRMITSTDDEGESSTEYQSRTPEEMQRLRSLVSASIGFDNTRGDELTVENISFSREPEQVSETVIEENILDQYKNYIYPVARYLLVFVMFGLFYLIIFRPVKNRVFSYIEVDDNQLDQLAAAVKDPELLAQLEQHLKNPDGSAPALPSANQTKIDPKAEANKELMNMAKDDPQVITQVIKNWLSEGVT
jgi:flagellar M-ring protein FliF